MHHDEPQGTTDLSPYYCTNEQTTFIQRLSKSNPRLLQKKKMQNFNIIVQPFAKTVDKMLKHLERTAS